MLTEKADRERTWGAFPALRQVLEEKRVPDEYYGWSSVSENVFSSFERLLKATIVCKENGPEIKRLAESIERGVVRADLERLRDMLQDERNILDNFDNDIAEIGRLLYEK